MLFFMIAVAAFAYLFMAGTIYKNFLPWRLKECDDCRGTSSYRCDFDHTSAAFFTSALWPLALPVVLAVYGTAILGVAHGGKSKDERRREAELAEAKHKVELARLSAQQTEALERAAL